MIRLLILTLLLIQVPVLAISTEPILNKGEHICTRADGCYADGRGQVPEHARIAPPNEEAIPGPHPTKTVVPWDRYYDTNKKGSILQELYLEFLDFCYLYNNENPFFHCVFSNQWYNYISYSDSTVSLFLRGAL